MSTMDNSKMFLYWGSGSMPCMRTMIVLAEKGLLKGLPDKVLDFYKAEHKSEEVMKLNPRGQLPTFKDEDIVVNESGAICMYLENNYSNDKNRLIPTDKAVQAQMFQRIFESENIMSKIMQPIAYKRLLSFRDKESWNTGQFEVARGELKLWNSYLEGTEYLAGSSFSMADVMFFPYLAFIVRMGAKLETNTNLQRYYDNICKRSTVQEAWPPHWRKSPHPKTMEDFIA